MVIEHIAISVEDLAEIAKWQGVEFKHGDLLIVRTGFIQWYESVDEETRMKAFAALEFAGVKAGEDTQQWLWNRRFCAVVADSVSMERKYTVYRLPNLQITHQPRLSTIRGQSYASSVDASTCRYPYRRAVELGGAQQNLHGAKEMDVSRDIGTTKCIRRNRQSCKRYSCSLIQERCETASEARLGSGLGLRQSFGTGYFHIIKFSRTILADSVRVCYA